MNDQFSEFRVKDDFDEFRVKERPNREAVLNDFGNIDNDVAQGIAPEQAKQGRVASYIASDGSLDTLSAMHNVEAYGAALVGKEDSDTN